MKKIILISLLMSFQAFAISTQSILTKADEVRNPSTSFVMKVKVEGHDKKVSRFDVFTKGANKTVIRTLAPKRDMGRNLLMIDENMWVYIPNLKRAVRISLAQKLSGQAANGDISRMRWAGDYEATIEKETKKEWQLFLTAKKKGLTYDKLRVWIEKKSFRPIKAEYLTVSKKPLKHATFGEYKKIAGGIRPTLITIVDALNKEKFSNIYIEELEKKNNSNSIFNRNNLRWP